MNSFFISTFCLSVICGLVHSQQAGTYKTEQKPTITLKECTIADGCTTKTAKLTLDANWRWIHETSGSSNCYTGDQWTSSMCSPSSDGSQCAQNCALEGVPLNEYRDTYGVEQVNDGVKINFVTQHQYGKNVGARLYLMENDDKYKMFYLKNREFAIDIDVSDLYCGMNGAMYFVEMEQYGGKGKNQNNAGAKYGTGYCDAQCPHDIKFIDGEANNVDWIPNPKDLDNNMGIGKYGSCCAEMDIWEANSMATAYTPHTCDPGITQYRCEGTACGDNDSGERYDGVCDKDGCDINPFRMGNPSFYGRGSNFAVDTLKPMTVLTQFITSDGTDSGDLVEIKRFYVQDGQVIQSPVSTILDPAGYTDSDSITDEFCHDKKQLFDDINDYDEKGGMKGMGDSLDRGQVAVLSLWDDVEVNMLWLDSAFPLDKDPSEPGVLRGDCPGGEFSTPTYLRNTYPDGHVIFRNAAIGEIGSTVDGVSPPSGWNTISFDDFENGWGSFTTGGTNAGYYSKGGRKKAYKSNASIWLRDDSGKKSSVFSVNSIDVSSYTQIKVNFRYIVHMFTKGEDFMLEYKQDGESSFTTHQSWMYKTNFSKLKKWFSATATIDTTHLTSIKLRLRCDASSKKDKVYIDDVEVLGWVAQ